MAGSTAQPGPMVAVHGFVEGFNNDDVDRMQAACADDTSVIDDFPPYQWTGHNATTTWYRDLAGTAAEYAMSEWAVEVEEPRHLVVSDGLAYVVVPVTARWLDEGTPAARTGSFTAALRELADGWRVTAFTWAWD